MPHGDTFPRRRKPGLEVLLSMLLAACSSQHSPVPPQQTTTPAIGPRQVQLGGAALALGEAEQVALTPEAFIRQIGTSLEARQRAVARQWVQRYPDIALEVLQGSSSADAALPALQFIAEVHDRHNAVQTATWSAILQERRSAPQRYAAFDIARQQLWAHLRQGQFPEAAAVPIHTTLRQSSQPVLAAEAWRLHGMALLLANQPGKAASALQQGRAQAGTPYQQSAIVLVQAEALRRAGHLAEASAVWQEAVRLATMLLHLPEPLADPVLWERLLALRPPEAAWPPETLRQVASLSLLRLPLPPDLAADESAACIWQAIGQWRLQRREPQAALLALRHAEAASQEPWQRDFLRLGQARALVQLEQSDAARAVLVGLSQHPQAQVARPAMALLGVLQLQRGQTRQGITLLRRAVEAETGLEWSGRGEAEADLGLAYLLLGEETPGLRWLHSAQQRFRAAGQEELLRTALRNEAHYLEHIGRRNEALAVRGQVQALEES